MSRHRIVRRMNYEDECCDDDDDYGHSYEDRYSVSPSTAAQFTYNRDRDLSLSNYMQDEIPEETEMEMEPEAEQEATGAAAGTGLTDVQKARLQSCVEEVHSIMGDTVPEAMVSETILRHDFNLEATLNELLARKDAPKSQRTPKKRKDRTQGDDTNLEDLLSEIDALDQQETVFMATGCRVRFGVAASPPSTILVPKKSGSGLSSDKSSPAFSANSPSSVTAGLSLSEMMKLSINHKTSGRLRNISVGSDYSSSDVDSLASSSPQQTSGLLSGKSLMELIQQQKTSEAVAINVSGEVQRQKKDTGLNLSDLINMQRKAGSPQPHSGKSSAEDGNTASSGLSLSELIAGQNKQPTAVESSETSATLNQSSGKKSSSGLSLSELIVTQDQQSSSTPSSSSQAQEKGGLSLTDLVNRHSSQKSSGPSVQFSNTGVKSKDTIQGLSLSELMKNKSDPEKKSSFQPKSSQSFSAGFLLTDMAKRHTSVQPGVQGTTADDKKGPQAGLSLSDLIKQRQGENAKPTVPSDLGKLQSTGDETKKRAPPIAPEKLQAANVAGPNTNPGKGGACLADNLKHSLVLRDGHQLIDTEEEGKGDVGLSLTDCLKKPVSVRSAHKPKRQESESLTEEMDEELVVSSEKSIDLDMDFITPVTVDPAMKKPPSLFARCICLRLQLVPGLKRYLKTASKSTQHHARFPKFQFQRQTRKLVTLTEAPLHNVVPFDFSTPSPDDVVKVRQRAAFTRTGQQVELEEGKI